MEWFVGLPTELQAMLVLMLGAPYLAMVIGRLVPYRQVKDWKELYFASEASRERALAALERGADALEATNTLVQATLAPIKEAHDSNP